MMLKIGDEYLDFNDDVEVEKQTKLFEQIDKTAGDVSYEFEAPFTSRNDRLLTFPLLDVSSKKIYKQIICDLLDNEGTSVYKGYIRIEKRDVINRVYKLAFFSGNSNWLSKLTGNVADADFSDYDTEINRLNIQSSWTKTDGVVFRFFDSGNLISRSHGKTVLEDWAPVIYAKTIFKKIFNSHSIEVQGELLNDWTFNNLLVCSNTHNENEIEARTVFANKSIVQTISGGSGFHLVTFQDVVNYPYYNSPNNNFDISDSSYNADEITKLRIDLHADINASFDGNNYFIIYKNGIFFSLKKVSNQIITQDFTFYVNVLPGDKIQVYTFAGTSPDIFVIVDATIKIYPTFTYGLSGKDIVPKWTQQQFISNVLSLFNVVSDYDPYSKVVTFNFFDTIKSKPPTTLPNTIQITDEDYTEFIDSFSRNNYFTYNDDSDDKIKEYNISNYVKYGAGNIQVDNDFLQDSVDVVQSDFTAPISYINQQFGSLSLERTNIFELQGADSPSVTGVSNNGSGVARFTVDANPFQVGNLVKIEMDNITYYNGEWVIDHVGTDYFEVSDIAFSQSDTGKATLEITKTTSNDNVYVFLDAGARNYIDISVYNLLYIENFAFTQPGYLYFNLLNIGKPVNQIFGQGLSFGNVNNILSYQRSLIDTYWQSFKKILNDPAKIYMKGYLSKNTFKEISPLNPVFIKDEQTSNIYYINRVTGYKNSYTPCTMELIKL